MWRPILIILVIFAVLYGAYWYMNKPEITEIDSSFINTEKVPFQSVVGRPFSKPLQVGSLDVSLSSRANYSISARILSKRKYVTGWESKISSWDYVLGWGDAAKINKIENLHIRQTVRWYSYKVASNIPMAGQYIATHTSNHHLIPKTENVRKAMLFLKKFDVVQMEGFLVDVHGNYKGRTVNWLTSMRRDDTGREACEIFLVESVKIGDRIYK
ncbi:MAG: hypothetical protein Q7J16_12885 [Candidatus Cloacimonadales bacterium]|nr:hypothetical protein [Candidatus Cloacimonadales bacterium]